jgi:hypothetical protein
MQTKEDLENKFYAGMIVQTLGGMKQIKMMHTG